MKKAKGILVGIITIALCVNTGVIRNETTVLKAKNIQNNSIVSYVGNNIRTKKEINQEPIKDYNGLEYSYVVYEDEEFGDEIVEDELWVSVGTCNKKEVVIPDTFQGKKVTQIAPDGFSDCNKLKSITLGKNIRIIREDAFDGCDNLTKVKFLGENCISIWSEAFSGCSSLKKLQLPKGLEFISSRAFEETGLEKIVIPDTVVLMGYNVFRDCKKLEKVKIGKKLDELKRNAFKNCSSLEEICIPKNVKIIDEKVFNNCKKLKEIKFKGNTYTIDVDAFKGTQFEKENRNKGDFYLVNGVLLEDYRNWKGDLIIDGKQKINGQKIRSVAGTAYMDNKKLGKVVLKNLKSVANNAFRNAKAKSLKIRNVGEIGVCSFWNFETSSMNLKEIDSLGHQCFYGAKAKELKLYDIGKWDSLYIPEGVEKFIVDGLKEESYLPDIEKDTKEAYLKGNFHEALYGYGEYSSSLEKLVIETPQTLVWYRVGRPAEDVWFRGSKNLKHIYLKAGGVSSSVKEVFPKNITLHVPAEQVEEYKKYVDCKVVAW